MRRMLAAGPAELFEFELVSRLLFVLVGRVVFPLTDGAIQTYGHAHCTSSIFFRLEPEPNEGQVGGSIPLLTLRNLVQ